MSITQYYNSSYYSTWEIPSGLKEVKITGSSKLGYGAFHNCSMIEKIILPKSITEYGYYAFSGTTNLKDVYYEGTIEDWNEIDIKSNNVYLTTATRYYFTNNGSLEIREGKWWYYDTNGEIVSISNDI